MQRSVGEWSRGEVRRHDRAAAGIFLAIHAALALIWLLAFHQRGSLESWVRWFARDPVPILYYLLWRLNALWLCVGVAEGRRWAFFGILLYGASAAIQSIFYSFHPYSLVAGLSSAYCALRLCGIVLGPAPKKTHSESPYLPDRLYAVASAALKLALLAEFAAHPLDNQPTHPLALAYGGVNILGTGWFCVALYRGHGWAVGVGAFGSVLGLLSLQAHPEQIAGMVSSWIGLTYFAARLAGLGPRPVGVLGLRSP